MIKSNIKLLLSTLLAIMLSTPADATDGDILNEDFTGITSINNNTTSWNGWTLSYCYYLSNKVYPQSLYLNYHIDNKYASATSPAFNCTKTCNAILTFKHTKTGSDSQFKLILNNNGTFTSGLKERTITSTGTSATLKERTIYLYNVDDKTTLTIKQDCEYGFVLDDVKITTSESVTISESAANSLENKTADITLVRTLKGGIWNTLCLPFNTNKASLEKALGSNQDIKLRTFSSFADNTITMADADAISAGTPFLIKINSTVENPVFILTTMVTTAAQTVSNNGVSMVGIYSPTDLPENGVFLSATDGKLKKPSGSRRMNGLRAYFVIPASVQNARVVINDEDATAISELDAEVKECDEKWFTIDGIQLESRPTKKGIYINNNRKIIIK